MRIFLSTYLSAGPLSGVIKQQAGIIEGTIPSDKTVNSNTPPGVTDECELGGKKRDNQPSHPLQKTEPCPPGSRGAYACVPNTHSLLPRLTTVFYFLCACQHGSYLETYLDILMFD